MKRRPAILSFAREKGVTTSADILAPGEQARDIVDWIAPVFGELDYLLPNDEQVLGLSGEDELEAGCRALVERGVGCVVATRGADGALIVDGDGSEGSRPSRSTWSTPPAAATPSRPASSGGFRWDGPA